MRWGRIGGLTVLAASACTVDTQPLEATGDYLPLTGGYVTGDVTVAGRLGVGTAAPEAWLHVRGNTSDVLSDGIRVDGDGACAEYQWATLNFRGGRARFTSTIVPGPGPCAIDSKGGFSFAAKDINGPVDRMTIDEQGNVGIGVANPGVLLDVGGSIRARTAAEIGSVNGSGLTVRGSEPYLTLKDEDGVGVDDVWHMVVPNGSGGLMFVQGASSYRLALSNSGRVGIGTTVPTAELEVIGTVKATAFQPPSSRILKRDIEYLHADDYDGMLGALGRLDAAHYRYKAGLGADDHARLGFIAEDLPPDVLSADGKAVDLYELVTFVAGATKAVDRQQRQAVDDLRTENDALRERVRALEAQVATQRDLAARLARLEAAMPTRGASRRAP